MDVTEEYSMKQEKKLSALAAGAVTMGLLLGASMAQAATVIVDGDTNTVTRIENLLVPDDQGRSTLYNVDFRYESGFSVYGQDLEDPGFPFIGANAEEDAVAVMTSINNALDDETTVPSSAGDPSQNIYYIGVEEETEGPAGFIGAVGSENLTGGFWDPCTTDCLDGVAVTDARDTLTYADFTEASAVVPVPAAVWLFGSGLLGLVGMARRKKTA
jgi:hypothetical protein